VKKILRGERIGGENSKRGPQKMDKSAESKPQCSGNLSMNGRGGEAGIRPYLLCQGDIHGPFFKRVLKRSDKKRLDWMKGFTGPSTYRRPRVGEATRLGTVSEGLKVASPTALGSKIAGLRKTGPASVTLSKKKIENTGGGKQGEA